MATKSDELLAQLGGMGRNRPASPSTPGFQNLNLAPPPEEEEASWFDALFSAEDALNLLPGNPGSDARDFIERAPLAGGLLGRAADIGFAPVSLATAGFGGPIAGALGQLGRGGRIAGSLFSPVIRGSLPARIGAEAGVGVASQIASEEVERRTDNPWLGAAAGIGAGAYTLRSIGNVQRALDPIRMIEEELNDADPARRLVGLIRQSQRQTRHEILPKRTEELARRMEAARGQLGNVSATGKAGAEQRSRIIGRNLQGDLEGQIRPLDTSKITPADVDTLYNRILSFPSFKYDSLAERRATTALGKLLAGETVQQNEAKLLGQVFGQDFEGAIRGRKLSETLLDIANIPRALLSAGDFSGPLRQGVRLIGRKEWWQSWSPMIKSFTSEARAREAMESITINDPMYLTRESAGLHMTPLFGGLKDREEAYMTSLADHLPIIGRGIKASERAYVVFLNKLRADVFDNTVQRYSRLGKNTPERRAELARWLNTATGRGNVAPNSLMAGANSVLFSPRLLYSWGETLNPATYIKADPTVRREMARDMATFVGMGLTAMGMMALAAKTMDAPFSIEIDPRSTDFGRVKSGDTRWDVWGGATPMIRALAQLYTGERKTGSGDIQDINRAIVAGRFGQSKLNPSVGLIVDMLRGETFLGDEVDFATSQGISEQAAERLAPLFLKDMYEAMQEDRVHGLTKTLPAAFGVGVNTYTSVGELRNQKAHELAGVTWDELTATEKQMIEEQNAEDFARVEKDTREGSIQWFVEGENEKARNLMIEYNTGLQSNVLDTRQFTQLMNQAMHDRQVANQAIRTANRLDDPNEQDLISQYLSLRDQASQFGVVDYALLDALQEDFKASRTSRERAVLNDFSRFEPPTEVQWWFDARDRIRTSGYWAAQNEAFNSHSQAVNQIIPGIQTRRELEVALAQETNRLQALRMSVLLKRVDTETDRLRNMMRIRDPQLDRALTQVYGTVPKFTTVLRFPELR
jgi:hypothetical protein